MRVTWSGIFFIIPLWT